MQKIHTYLFKFRKYLAYTLELINYHSSKTNELTNYSEFNKQMTYNTDILTKLFDRLNLIITSDHGMDSASFEKSIDLNDYVDINKFDSYGGLTQINIFPKNCKDLSVKKINHLNFNTNFFL